MTKSVFEALLYLCFDDVPAEDPIRLMIPMVSAIFSFLIFICINDLSVCLHARGGHPIIGGWSSQCS